MKIIAPLRIPAVSSLLMTVQKARIVQIAFRDAMNHPSQPLRQVPDRALEFGQKVTRAEIENSVHGIQTERIEVIILKPAPATRRPARTAQSSLTPTKLTHGQCQCPTSCRATLPSATCDTRRARTLPAVSCRVVAPRMCSPRPPSAPAPAVPAEVTQPRAQPQTPGPPANSSTDFCSLRRLRSSFRRHHRSHDLLAKLGTHPLDLQFRDGHALLDLALPPLPLLGGRSARLGQPRVALRLPLLQPLLPRAVDIRLGLAQPVFVVCRLGLGSGDRVARLFNRTRRPRTPLGRSEEHTSELQS